MPKSRSRLVLDEESFQGLLAAAFTIQEHNDKLSRAANRVARPEAVAEVTKIPERRCPRCAALLKPGETLCSECLASAFRPVERLPLRFPPLPEVSQDQCQRLALSGESGIELARSTPASIPSFFENHLEKAAVDAGASCQESEEESAVLDVAHPEQELGPAFEEAALSTWGNAAGPTGTWQRLRHSMRVASADAYLWLAIVVATVAILWPAPAPLQKPRLQPWQRILVKLGIAEAPPPQVHYRGDPNVQVWVDPHTALYYCPGAEQYAKTPDGRFTAQREAQLDEFEPAGRAVCQ